MSFSCSLLYNSTHTLAYISSMHYNALKVRPNFPINLLKGLKSTWIIHPLNPTGIAELVPTPAANIIAALYFLNVNVAFLALPA